ncbi:MAG: aspartate aminotransferase family protein [Candidatus Limnocylindrales bacterium]
MALLDAYLERTPRSCELFERATRSLPGGSTRTTVYSAPYPPYIAAGEGLTLRDVDGNVYRDFLGNYTALILGHAHPAVVAAVESQVRRGSAFAAPTETEIELAEELRRRLPSLERLRFTNSGTEATMFAIRAARAFTARPLVATFEHSYHGTHDGVMAGTPGVPAALSGLVVELPWEDADGVERALRGRERDLAAIIIEPVQGAGGVRAASSDFLAFLRSFADRHGALLIFDEIIAFRVGLHGAQGAFGVRPDLTTLGKIIGGGYALAAFGGRADVMDLFDARRAGSLSHGGTFNGNPVAAAAGLATLRELTPAVFARLDALGGRLRAQVAGAIGRDGLDARIASSDRSSRSGRARACQPSRPVSVACRSSSSACCSRGSTWRLAGWARSRRSRRSQTSTTWPPRSSGCSLLGSWCRRSCEAASGVPALVSRRRD